MTVKKPDKKDAENQEQNPQNGGSKAAPAAAQCSAANPCEGGSNDKKQNETCKIDSIDLSVEGTSIPVFNAEGQKNNRLYILTDDSGKDLTLKVKRTGDCGKSHKKNSAKIKIKKESAQQGGANNDIKSEWKEENKSFEYADDGSVKITYYDRSYIAGTRR